MRILLFIILLLTLLVGCVAWWHLPVTSDGSISVVMCPACKDRFAAAIAGSADTRCALYDVGSIQGALLVAAGAAVVTDDGSGAAMGSPYRSAGLMHHKFCVVNESVVVTGSYNPTDTGHLSANNLLVIESEAVAAAFLAEFRSLDARRPRVPIRHRFIVGDVPLAVHFCPRDACERRVLTELEAAQTSVVFFTYSFTSDAVGDVLLRLRSRGVSVEGACEPSQASRFSECARLGALLWDGPHLLHHKVFVIDDETVIAGSYNPTANANERNQETLLIIRDRAIAATYRSEYARLTAP